MIQNNNQIASVQLPCQPVYQCTQEVINPDKVSLMAPQIVAGSTPAATTRHKFSATLHSIGALAVSALTLIARAFQRLFPASAQKSAFDFNVLHKSLYKAYFEADSFDQLRTLTDSLQLFKSERDIAKLFTQEEIERINLKFIALFLQEGAPTTIAELEQFAPFMALLTDETRNWIETCLNSRPLFHEHVNELESASEVNKEVVAAEIKFIETESQVIYYEFHKNSKAWRHYFFEIAQMIKQAPEEQRKALGDAFYSAIAPADSERESFSSYLERFHAEGNAAYVLNETLKLPAPHGQIALNIAVASGLIDLSQPPEYPLFHELANKKIAEEVINRLITTMCYHKVDLNCADREGNTLLHRAIINQNVSLVIALVLNGAKFDLLNHAGSTALFLARELAGNENQVKAKQIYQTLLFGLTQTLVTQRLMPISVMPNLVGGTPLASKLNKGKKVKRLVHLQKILGGKVINPLAFKSAGASLGFVANLVKIGESERAHKEAIEKLQSELSAVEGELRNSCITPEGKEAYQKRKVELEAKINELNAEKNRVEKSAYLDAAKNGMGVVQNVLKWVPKTANAFSQALPLFDIASNVFSVWQNSQSADENSIKKQKDEQLLKLVEAECGSFERMADSFPEDQFIQRLLKLKLLERSIQKQFLKNRIHEYETAEIDAGIDGRAAAVQGVALGMAAAFPPAAAPLLMAAGIAGKATPIRNAIRMGQEWFFPAKMTDINHFAPAQFEAYDGAFEERCLGRLGLEQAVLEKILEEVTTQMNEEEEKWFLVLLNQAGIPCDREQFAKDKRFYILRYIVE